MNYGFVIDNRKCIGCHACTTACKSENDVPLSVNRTWVKYVEEGQYPDVKRNFQVTRCNHCANPPCVKICPVTAMYQRDDGIVEFDQEVCIGCKACMQACPYDAIYIDPDTQAAAKCHYCAHRIDVGMEPACVVVCPEHAIISGDMDDPESEISRILADNDVTSRKPEQGTAPKLYYINGNENALDPLSTEPLPDTFIWSDVIQPDAGKQTTPTTSNGAVEAKASTRIAGQMVQVAYNAQHEAPWHWPVAAYMVTKAISAGIVMLLALIWGTGIGPFDPLTAIAMGIVAHVFIEITSLFLVFDLEKPELFLTILTRPNWDSWLAKGAYILIGYSVLLAVWIGVEIAGYNEVLVVGSLIRNIFLWSLFALAAATAVYTALLFGQAEGRDLWQSRYMALHLYVQALMAGAATMLIASPFFGWSNEFTVAVSASFALALIFDLGVCWLEFGSNHESKIAAAAAHEITSGRYRNLFWIGSLLIGHLLPLALIVAGLFLTGLAYPVAGLLALAGLYCYEHAFVMAPQRIPNS
ncbi:MAG: 4Fe-4S dicluster domain-containing protein [Planctomycetota bacterium]